jgi:ABC-type Fe3+ transport system substrate-binding protein
MNWKIYVLFSGLFTVLNSCVLDEAKPSAHEKIVVYTDFYCPADSLIIKEFEQSKNISVQMVYLSQEEIAQSIRKNKFNTGIDVLLLSSDSLRESLYNKSLFSQLRGRSFFRNIDRQFNNNHGYWIPICHNPLILVTEKDSSANCSPMNWNKFNTDSIHPKIAVESNASSYLMKLKKTSKFSSIAQSAAPNSQKYVIYTLSQVVELSNRDIHYEKSKCFYYLVEKQRFMTNFTSVSLYKYSRNKVASQQFIEFYTRFQHQIASNRNQLSTFKTIQPNFLIRSLEIH